VSLRSTVVALLVRTLRPCRAALAATTIVCCLSGSFAARADQPAGSPTSHAPPDMPDLSREDLSFVSIPDLPPDFETRDGGWIRFAFPSSDRAMVQGIVHDADDVRGSLSSELGADVLGRLEVRIARTPTEMAALSPPDIPPPRYAAAVAYARMRLVVLSMEAPQSAELPDLGQSFRHELAHVALYDATAGRAVPRWFNEGYAIHASGESSLLRARTLWSATLSKRLLPLSDIERGFPADGDQAAIAYAESADFLRFLLRRQDRGRFRRMVGRVASGQPFERALRDAYSSNLRGLEYEWRVQLNERYSYVPVFLGGGMLWLLVFVVVGVGWYRRRQRHKVTLQRWAQEEAIAEARRSTGADVLRIKLIPRPRAPISVLSNAGGTETLPVPPPPVSRRVLGTTDVPKIEHDGRWHTLH